MQFYLGCCRIRLTSKSLLTSDRVVCAPPHPLHSTLPYTGMDVVRGDVRDFTELALNLLHEWQQIISAMNGMELFNKTRFAFFFYSPAVAVWFALPKVGGELLCAGCQHCVLLFWLCCIVAADDLCHERHGAVQQQKARVCSQPDTVLYLWSSAHVLRMQRLHCV